MAVTFLGLTFGDDGTGFVFPTYAQLRTALGNYWRTLRNLPIMNLAPGSFFGDMLDIGASVVHAGAQAAADAAAKSIFTQAEGTSLDQLVAPVTVRLAATASRAEVYAYGLSGATVPINSIVRTSPTAPAFVFGAGVTIPLAINTTSWVFEVEDFGAGGAAGVTFTLTVDGNPFAVTAGATDDSREIRDNLVGQVNGAAITQEAFPAGTLPNAEPTRWGGLVRATVGGPFLTTFVSTGPPSLTSVYSAEFDVVAASQAGAIQAPAESLRFGQGFANIVGYVNVEGAIVGRDRETDSQLRARHLVQQRQGFGNPDAIRAGVLAPVDIGGAGATYASVEYNSTNAIDAVGNKPHSIRVIVDQFVDKQVVANVVWRLKAAGDDTNGPFLLTVLDAEGNNQEILLDELVTLYIWSDIEVTPGEEWPNVGDPITQLREDVVAYINALGGNGDVKVNDAPVSNFPNGEKRGVANFRLRFGYSTDPAGLAPPITYLAYWPTPEPNAATASISITSRQVAETNLSRISATIV